TRFMSAPGHELRTLQRGDVPAGDIPAENISAKTSSGRRPSGRRSSGTSLRNAFQLQEGQLQLIASDEFRLGLAAGRTRRFAVDDRKCAPAAWALLTPLATLDFERHGLKVGFLDQGLVAKAQSLRIDSGQIANPETDARKARPGAPLHLGARGFQHRVGDAEFVHVTRVKSHGWKNGQPWLPPMRFGDATGATIFAPCRNDRQEMCAWNVHSP